MKEYSIGTFKVREYEEVESTNTVAAGLPLEEQEDRLVVLARAQTRGRGQVGNSWESEPGKNVSMTIVLRPMGLSAMKQFAVSMAVALGVRDWVGELVPGCTVKWPNDVYVGERKVAGILIEHTVVGEWVETSLCGVGLNVNQERFVSDAPNPVSLRQLLGYELALDMVLEELLGCIGARLDRVGDYAALEGDFLRWLYRREGVFSWQEEGGKVFRASIEGIDEFGRLLLKDERGGVSPYGFKEVRYL